MDPGIIKFCQNFSKISSISSIMMPQFWPAVSPLPPWGGIMMGLTQNTNVVVDLCDFVLAFGEWDESQKIHGSKRFVNDLTGRKFQDDFDMVDKTWNLANSVYDFESGEKRKGALESEQSNRELNDYMRDLNEYTANKQMSEAEKRRANSGYTGEIQQFSSLVAKSANIDDAMNCPDASNNPKYQELYEKNIAPEAAIRVDAINDQNFYKERLYELGKFMFKGDLANFDRYMADTDRLEVMAVGLEAKESKYEEETSKPGKRKNSKGHVIPEKKVLIKKYQIYDTKVYDQVFSTYKEKYSDKWKEAVKWEYLSKTTEFGAFAGADERVERTFRNFNYECSEKKIMGNYDVNKPDYDAQYEKKKTQCEESLNVNEKKAENLFQYYAVQYQNSLYKEKKSLAKIWTFESRYLGANRMVSGGNAGAGFKTENVKCENNLEPADMEKLALKQQSVNNELKEMIAKNKIKKNVRESAQKESENKYKAETDRKKKMVDLKASDQKKQDKMNTGLTPSRSGIGGGK